jgi:hypothetical protein
MDEEFLYYSRTLLESTAYALGITQIEAEEDLCDLYCHNAAGSRKKRDKFDWIPPRGDITYLTKCLQGKGWHLQTLCRDGTIKGPSPLVYNLHQVRMMCSPLSNHFWESKRSMKKNIFKKRARSRRTSAPIVSQYIPSMPRKGFVEINHCLPLPDPLIVLENAKQEYNVVYANAIKAIVEPQLTKLGWSFPKKHDTSGNVWDVSSREACLRCVGK